MLEAAYFGRSQARAAKNALRYRQWILRVVPPIVEEYLTATFDRVDVVGALLPARVLLPTKRPSLDREEVVARVELHGTRHVLAITLANGVAALRDTPVLHLGSDVHREEPLS